MVYFKYYYLKNILSPKNVRGLRRQRLRLTKVAGSIQVGKKRPAITLTARAETAARAGQHELWAAALLPAGHARLSNSPCFCDHRLQGCGGALGGELGHLQPALPGSDHALRTPSGQRSAALPGSRPRKRGQVSREAASQALAADTQVQ